MQNTLPILSDYDKVGSGMCGVTRQAGVCVQLLHVLDVCVLDVCFLDVVAWLTMFSEAFEYCSVCHDLVCSAAVGKPMHNGVMQTSKSWT